MKTYGLAPLAVIALWLGLSSVWMGQSAAPWAALAQTADNPTESLVAAVPSGPVMIDLSSRAPLGPVMTELRPVAAAPVAAPASDTTPAMAPAAPAAAMPPTVAADETLLRLQALEAKLTVALNALEQGGTNRLPDPSTVQAPSFFAQLAAVIASAPVIGFLVMLLLALAAAAWGQRLREISVVARLKATLHRLTAPQGADQALPTTTSSDLAPAGKRQVYGEIMSHIQANGEPLQAGVFNENQVRAAAGLTLALGAVAFAYAAIGKVYLPIQTVTALFFAEFLIRVIWGINRSPLGLIAGWMTRRTAPHWVSAKPKRFAWSLGLVMSLAMVLITNGGIRGPLPLTICLICLTLMWLEAVLGLCLGCEMHRYLVRWGWMQPDKDFEICSNGACTVPAHPQLAR